MPPPFQNNPMSSALLYVRVSSKEQEKEGYSLDAQEKLGYEYAGRRGFKIVKMWKVSESAWNNKKDRVAFIQMVEYSKAHPEIEHIIFDITDRMTRNDFDKIKIVDLIQYHNKSIHFSRSNKIYNRASSPDDLFMLDIEVAVAKKMSNDISRKTRMGMLEKAEQGIFPSYAPLGYTNNKATRQLEINAPQARYIKKAFDLMATGNYSIEILARQLIKEDCRTNRGAKVNKSTLAFVLKNPFYFGNFVWKGKQYQGNHEPIINKATFDRVQMVLSGKRLPHINRLNFAFNNLITCGECGCKVSGEQKHKPVDKTYTYYHCTFSKGRHPNRAYIPQNRLAKMFEEPVRQIQVSDDFVDWMKEGLTIKARDGAQSQGNRLLTLQKQLAIAEQRINRLFDDRMDGKINNEELARAKEAEYTANINDLKAQISQAETTNPRFLEDGLEALELPNLLYSQYFAGTPEEKGIILRKIASNYTLRGATLCATYRRPFSIFAKGPSCPTWLPILDTGRTIFSSRRDIAFTVKFYKVRSKGFRMSLGAPLQDLKQQPRPNLVKTLATAN